MEKSVTDFISDVLISKGKRNQHLRGGAGTTIPGIAHRAQTVGQPRQPVSLNL